VVAASVEELGRVVEKVLDFGGADHQHRLFLPVWAGALRAE
jgi:hypothetical protein